MGVYGALLVLLLIVIGLAVHNVTVPVQAADGTTTYVNVDLGPALAIVAIIAALIFALVIWLLQFTVARGIVLGLEVVGLLGLLGNTHTFSGSSAYAVGTIVGAVVNLFFIIALTMSLIYRRPA